MDIFAWEGETGRERRGREKRGRERRGGRDGEGETGEGETGRERRGRERWGRERRGGRDGEGETGEGETGRERWRRERQGGRDGGGRDGGGRDGGGRDGGGRDGGGRDGGGRDGEGERASESESNWRKERDMEDDRSYEGKWRTFVHHSSGGISRNMRRLLSANDLAVVADSDTDLQERLVEWKEIFGRHGLCRDDAGGLVQEAEQRSRFRTESVEYLLA